MDGNLLSPEHPAVLNGLIDRDGAAVTAQEPVVQEAVVESQQDAAPEAPAYAREELQETSEERNFRNLRQKAARLERERDEAMQRLRTYEKPAVEEQDLTIGNDDLAEGKHINKVQSKIKNLEAQLIETRLRTQYPDIDSVVSEENLATLQREYPDIATTIGSSSNLYSKAVSAYTILKKLGIHNSVSPYEQEKAAAQRNAAKPRPLASVSPQQGDSPLSHANAFANGLTDSLKEQLRKEMAAAMRNR